MKFNDVANSTITLEPLSRDNIAQALELAVEIFGEADRAAIQQAYEKSIGLRPEDPPFSSALQVINRHYFIARDGEHCVGVTGYYGFEGKKEDVWLGWMGVHPSARGKKVGDALTEEPFKIAAANGAQTLRIWTITEAEYDNAQRLYSKLGFERENYAAQPVGAQSMIRIFSKPAQSHFARRSWLENLYPIDCENYTIPQLNEILAAQQNSSAPHLGNN